MQSALTTFLTLMAVAPCILSAPLERSMDLTFPGPKLKADGTLVSRMEVPWQAVKAAEPAESVLGRLSASHVSTPEAAVPIRPVPKIPPGFEAMQARPELTLPKAPTDARKVEDWESWRLTDPAGPPRIPAPGPSQWRPLSERSDRLGSTMPPAPSPALNQRALPWKWIIPSVLAGGITDHIFFSPPPVRRPPPNLDVLPPPGTPTHPSSSHGASHPMRRRADKRGMVPPVSAIKSAAIHVPWKAVGISAALGGLADHFFLAGRSAAAAAEQEDKHSAVQATNVPNVKRKLPLKWIAGGAMSGVLLDELLFRGST